MGPRRRCTALGMASPGDGPPAGPWGSLSAFLLLRPARSFDDNAGGVRRPSLPRQTVISGRVRFLEIAPNSFRRAAGHFPDSEQKSRPFARRRLVTRRAGPPPWLWPIPASRGRTRGGGNLACSNAMGRGDVGHACITITLFALPRRTTPFPMGQRPKTPGARLSGKFVRPCSRRAPGTPRWGPSWAVLAAWSACWRAASESGSTAGNRRPSRIFSRSAKPIPEVPSQTTHETPPQGHGLFRAAGKSSPFASRELRPPKKNPTTRTFTNYSDPSGGPYVLVNVLRRRSLSLAVREWCFSDRRMCGLPPGYFAEAPMRAPKRPRPKGQRRRRAPCPASAYSNAGYFPDDPVPIDVRPVSRSRAGPAHLPRARSRSSSRGKERHVVQRVRSRSRWKEAGISRLALRGRKRRCGASGHAAELAADPLVVAKLARAPSHHFSVGRLASGLRAALRKLCPRNRRKNAPASAAAPCLRAGAPKSDSEGPPTGIARPSSVGSRAAQTTRLLVAVSFPPGGGGRGGGAAVPQCFTAMPWRIRANLRPVSTPR